MFCEKECFYERNHPDRTDWRHVQVLSVRETLLSICSSRNDQLAENVKRRLLDCIDLVAAEARYHFHCRCEFKRNIPASSTPGRPSDQDRMVYFNAVCTWLESEAEIHTVTEIYNKMVEIAGSEDSVYSQKWLKTKLKERYGDHITFSEGEGKGSKVCFRNMMEYLINDKWYQDRKSSTQDEAERIISMAANLILDDIRSSKFDCEWYPTTEIMQSTEHVLEWIPSKLRLFMQCICKNTLKQSSIGQVLVSATHPRSCVPPILFGLGVDVDHVFGSRWLIDQLNKFGFCVSMDEVTRYKQSVMENDSYDIEVSKLAGSFTQWSADNVDHNVRTLDGKGSLHGMGIIFSTTSKFGPSYPTNHSPIKRNKLKKVEDVIKQQGIPITKYSPSSTTGLSKLIFKERCTLDIMQDIHAPVQLDLLWNGAIFLRAKGTRPNWSGYMTEVCNGKYPGKSTVSLLPIIDLNPSDLSCIYSTLLFIIDQSKFLKVQTPVVTFDQPLWLKAMEVVQAKSLKVVLILGGFHLMMSFIGSIGHLMKGSGISEALTTVYGPNAVEHMLSGKAISRALRGHFLIASALHAKLLSAFFPAHIERIELSTEEEGEKESQEDDVSDSEVDISIQKGPVFKLVDPLTTEQVDNLEVIDRKLHEDPINFEVHLQTSEELIQLEDRLKRYKDYLAIKSRTAKFWLQYIHYIDVLKLFIYAERSGNWALHLSALSKMIDLFAATGHYKNAKCARLHLQQMLELETIYPLVHTNFLEHGYHTVRRSDRFWAGLWTDLVIEQVLMRALKSRGGLTHGRGVSESVRLMWVKTMHRCASVHNAMSDLTGLLHKTSEQHTELGQSRIKRDNADLQKIINWFCYHNPFSVEDPSLRSLSTGLTAMKENGINCDDADSVGRSIQKKLDNVCIEDAKFCRKDQVKTLDSLWPSITIRKKVVHIDPAILFTRLTAILQREECVAEHFKYELTPEPTALFKDGMMRKSNKSILRNAILDNVESDKVITARVCIVDGGALLHKVKWQPNSTFKGVVNTYSEYVRYRYKSYERCCVVFDGYSEDMSIKSTEHARRGLQTASANVTISERMTVTTTREMFLRNTSNKEQFIQLLGAHLEAGGVEVVYSRGDADVLIVEKALEKAISEEVVVSAEDTDVLVLLMSHWNETLHDIIFCAERKEKPARVLKSYSLQELVGSCNYKEHILFAHAWTGCDSTSAMHRQGKSVIHFSPADKGSLR